MKRSCFEGCFCSKAGFTLIELLVVVLIIGILAAVAVPQYQKAVRKARVAEAKIILKKLTDAQDLYFTTYGADAERYSSISDWNEVLDIEVPESTSHWSFETDDCANGADGMTGCANYAHPQWESGYVIGYYSTHYEGGVDPVDGHFICKDDEAICAGLGGVADEEWTDYYILP